MNSYLYNKSSTLSELMPISNHFNVFNPYEILRLNYEIFERYENTKLYTQFLILE